MDDLEALEADLAGPCNHAWATIGVVIDADGAHTEVLCAWCGAEALVGPDELAGRSG